MSISKRCDVPPKSRSGVNVEVSGNISIKKPSVDLAFTGERYTTAASGEIRHEHYHRYLFALQFCRGKVVLDIACGEGYGSALIGGVASQVTGVDIAGDAVRHAAASYRTDNVSFAVGECADIPLADASVDVVVSFETLEHVADQNKFLREIKRVLRPEGVLVISTPNTDVYKEILTEANPFHVKELNEAEFRSILGENFTDFRLFGQRSVVGSAIVPQITRLGEADAQQSFTAKDRGNISVVPGIGAPTYFIAVASDATLPRILHGLLDDRPFLMELYALLQERAINVLQAEHQSRISEGLRANAIRELEDHVRNGLTVQEETTAWKTKLDRAKAEVAPLQAMLQEARAETNRLKSELERVKVAARRESDSLKSELEQVKVAARRESDSLKSELEQAKVAVDQARTRWAEVREAGYARENEILEMRFRLDSIYASAAWRFAAPVRLGGKIVRAIRSRRSTAWLVRPAARASPARPPAILEHQTRLIVEAGLFDEAYYFRCNPDVEKSGISGAAHFLLHGESEGRKPNRLFDPVFYRETYPDVARAGQSPLLHYIQFGAVEGRNPGPDFDPRYYLEAYPDVGRALLDPLFHFLHFGESEGRRPKPPALLRHSTERRIDALYRARRLASEQQAKLAYRPLISLLVPTYNTDPVYLEAAIRSVVAQAYTNWELHLVDDGSTRAATLAALDRIASLDERIFVTKSAQNRGISHATNTALQEARGEYVAMLDHDDELTPDALFEVARALNVDKSLDVVYTDQDYVTPDGAQSGHLLKPDWSPHLFRGVMFVGHLLTVRRTLAIEVRGFDPAYDFVQDFEFMLRVSERTRHIQHVPKVLYHWRRIPESVAGGGKGAVAIEQLQAVAVQAHLRRLGLAGRATPNPVHPHRVTIEPDGHHADVSIDWFVHGHAAPLAGLATIERLVAQTSHRPARIVVQASWSNALSQQALRGPYVADCAPTLLDEADRLRCLLDKTAAEFVILISADVRIESTDWLERLLLPSQEPDVVAVCGTVLSPEGSVSHAGLVLGRDAELRPAMRGFDPLHDGYAGSMSCAREISTAWADVVLLRRSALSAYLTRATAYRSAAFLVADLILRATRSGLRAICIPEVRAHRSEPAGPVAPPIDAMVFRDVWEGIAPVDPYYNPNFLGEGADYT
jgi:SAM-dependent methyltransferase